jgi:alpha-galactosidase
MNEKVVLIGAGSASFTKGLVADMIRQGWEGELTLVDTDPAALDTARKLTAKMLALGNSAFRLSSHTDRRNALKDATAVICTIGVGGRRAWEKDVFIPRKHGIYQPVGDSVMPGGTSRALRMVPAMIAIAEDVMRLAPNALFFNYGNPMSVICRAVRKATGANMTGLCHGVPHVSRMLAEILGAEKERLRFNACGINHLTWFTEIWADGKDLMPELLKKAAAAVERPAGDLNPLTWELTLLFGAFPAVLDRHVAEFFPQMTMRKGGYYGKTIGVDAFSFEGTIECGDKMFENMRKEAASAAPLGADWLGKSGGEHEQVTEIIESIRKDKDTVFSANLPNKGQIPNLPYDAVVEGPAVAGGAGLRPLMLKALPSALAGTLATRFMWAEVTAEAAIEGSRDKFVQALLLDGAVTSVKTARDLADELLAAHAEYLPQFKK